jgi:hypothetical protein
VASADIARSKNDAARCQDFVLAGEANVVKIRFA